MIIIINFTKCRRLQYTKNIVTTNLSYSQAQLQLAKLHLSLCKYARQKWRTLCYTLIKNGSNRKKHGLDHLSGGHGEVGRGRKFMALTCPKGTVLKEGMNPDFTIGTTKSGKPRINKRDDNTLYMMLSSKGGIHQTRQRNN